jgi:hypothetical protein
MLADSPNRLRLNDLKPVYHGETGVRMLRELARSYLTIVKDLSRLMNRLKALYRSWAIPSAGRDVYYTRHRSEWLGKIPEAGILAELAECEAEIRKQGRYSPARRRARGTPIGGRGQVIQFSRKTICATGFVLSDFVEACPPANRSPKLCTSCERMNEQGQENRVPIS